MKRIHLSDVRELEEEFIRTSVGIDQCLECKQTFYSVSSTLNLSIHLNIIFYKSRDWTALLIVQENKEIPAIQPGRGVA